MYSHCLSQVVNRFGKTCWQLVTTLLKLFKTWFLNFDRCIRIVGIGLDPPLGCNNIVIPWLYRTCWNNLVTSLIISTRLLPIVNSLFQTVDNLWQAVRRQLVDGLLTNLLQDVRVLRVYDYTRKNLTSCNKSVHKLSTRCIRTACHKLSTGLEKLVDNL